MFIPREESGKIHHCKINKIYENNLPPKQMKEGLEIYANDFEVTEDIATHVFEMANQFLADLQKTI